MKRTFPIFLIVLAFASAIAQTSSPFRPPSIPLIAHDPYFSIWSPYNLLTEGATTHWTGAAQPLSGMVGIDGKQFQLLGQPARGNFFLSSLELSAHCEIQHCRGHRDKGPPLVGLGREVEPAIRHEDREKAV